MIKKIIQKMDKFKSKSYYNKFYTSFLLVMLVPMLTTILIFVQAQSVVREQILLSSKNTLNQFFQRIDSVIEEGWSACVTIASSEQCKLYVPRVTAEPIRMGYLSYEINKLLGNYMGERCYDIFVYYPSMDRVISKNFSASTLKYYYTQNYSAKSDFYEEMYAIANSPDGKPVLYSMNGEQEDSYLCIAMREKSSRDETKHYVIGIVFEPTYIKDLIQGVEENLQNGISMIFNKKQELLRFTGNQNLDFHLNGYQQGKASYEENFDGEKYVMQVRESELLDAYYAYAVPTDYFWSRLFQLYVICGVSIVISNILAFYISKRQTVKNYIPFRELINNLQEQKSLLYDAKAYTELEFIERILEKTAEEKLTLDKEVREGKIDKKEKFILSLLNGSVKATEKEEDVFKKNGIMLCSYYFCLAVFQIEQAGIVASDLVSFVVCNVFKELCNRDFNGYVIPAGSDRFVILVNLVDKENESLYSMLEEGKMFLEQYLNMRLTIGVSSIKEGMQGIHLAWEEAGLALKYRYLLGKEIIIDYAEIEDREFKNVPSSELKMLYKVTEYVSGKMQDTLAYELVNEITTDYGIDQDISLEEMECFKFETISTINRVMRQEGYSAEACKDSMNKLLDRETLEEFKAVFAEILTKIYQKKQSEDDGQEICMKALKYIEKHYNDEQLSIAVLGECAGVVPYYLSRLFKEKYGITVTDYIAQTRVKNAKRLLRETNLNIQEVALNVGFVNSNSFIRTFKKQEGITPGVYRELEEGKK